jgi:hypothetical protein
MTITTNIYIYKSQPRNVFILILNSKLDVSSTSITEHQDQISMQLMHMRTKYFGHFQIVFLRV